MLGLFAVFTTFFYLSELCSILLGIFLLVNNITILGSFWTWQWYWLEMLQNKSNMAITTQSFQDESGETQHRQMSILTFNLRLWWGWRVRIGKHPFATLILFTWLFPCKIKLVSKLWSCNECVSIQPLF